jgi:hypothetical protein
MGATLSKQPTWSNFTFQSNDWRIDIPYVVFGTEHSLITVTEDIETGIMTDTHSY